MMLAWFRKRLDLHRKDGWSDVFWHLFLISYMAPLVGLFCLLESRRMKKVAAQSTSARKGAATHTEEGR